MNLTEGLKGKAYHKVKPTKAGTAVRGTSNRTQTSSIFLSKTWPQLSCSQELKAQVGLTSYCNYYKQSRLTKHQFAICHGGFATAFRDALLPAQNVYHLRCTWLKCSDYSAEQIKRCLKCSKTERNPHAQQCNITKQQHSENLWRSSTRSIRVRTTCSEPPWS